MLFADSEKLQAAFDNTFRGITVAVADAIGQRSVVNTYANSPVMFLTNVEKGHKSLLNFLQFLCIFLVGIIVLDEAPRRIDIVSRVNSHLLGVESGDVCHVRVEMNISYKRCRKAVIANTFADIVQVFSLSYTLRREPDEFASSLNDTFSLCYTSLGIVGIGGCHRLYTHWVFTANGDTSHVRC